MKKSNSSPKASHLRKVNFIMTMISLYYIFFIYAENYINLILSFLMFPMIFNKVKQMHNARVE